ncbi:MAG: zinc ribbon domain-containing protein, partial [bacterium]
YPFTSDVNAIIANINALTTAGGGDDPEAVYEALLRAMDNITLGPWRNGVGKIIILMGDAAPHEKGEISDDGSYTYQYTGSDVATVAQNLDPARIFPVLTGEFSDEAKEFFTQLATLTGGQVFTADEASKVPEVIASVISTAVAVVSRALPASGTFLGLSTQWWIIGGAGLGVLLLAVLVLALILRSGRRRRQVPAAPYLPQVTVLPPTLCPTCGSTLIPGQRFCGNCGADSQMTVAPPVAPPATFCPSCGRLAIPGQRFCQGCGGALPGDPA